MADVDGVASTPDIEADAVQIQHPHTGDTHDISVPRGHTDPFIRVEFPDGVKMEWENPNGIQPVDPAQDDVIYNPETGEWVQRVGAGEGGGSAEAANA